MVHGRPQEPAVEPACRSCGEGRLEPILSLGQTPLANALLRADELRQPEEYYPLALVLCPRCSLVQITETVAPEKLFREYLYFSSVSETMLAHAKELTARLTASRKLGPESLVVEAASNDGYLLQFYKERGIPVLGVEPAMNIARVARERGIPTVDDFFGIETARRLRGEGKRADVIHANNVLAHVADINGFVEGFAILLADDGVAVIETPYVKDMIDRNEFDTIYHEHLFYYSLTALEAMFRRHGLLLTDVERIAIHGGSLRVTAGKAGHATRGPAVQALLDEEQTWGVDQLDCYREFARRVEHLKEALRTRLGELKQAGKRIAAYGASAKGSTLLNYFGIGRETIDFVVDRSTVKQGRFTPGTHLPILPPETLLKEMPDYLLLLTWNFADEILRQQAEYRRRGGRFLIPVPEVKVA